MARRDRGAAEYEKFHWGEAATVRRRINDPDLPQLNLIECGRFYGLDVRRPGGKKQRYTLDEGKKDQAHVAYDADHWRQRLYIIMAPSTREHTKRWYAEVGGPIMSLYEWARIVGGKHAKKDDYPKVRGRLVGALDTIRYHTVKTGDGSTVYFHEHGEESQQMPGLVVDAKGRLWFVGGSYGVVREGIFD